MFNWLLKRKKDKEPSRSDGMSDRVSDLLTSDKTLHPLPTRAMIEEFLESHGTADHRLIASPEFATLHPITDSLFLTSFFGLCCENLSHPETGCQPRLIINASSDLPSFRGPWTTYRVAVEDDRNTTIYPFLSDAADAINTAIKGGGNVIVHCMAGVSRSASIVMAYLIKWKKMSLRTAYNTVVSIRPVARPNSTFLSQLGRFEREVIGVESTNMICVRKNGKVIELPDFLPYDQPKQFESEFIGGRVMNVVPDIYQHRPSEQQTPVLIDVDRYPEFFKTTSLFQVRQTIPMRYSSGSSLMKSLMLVTILARGKNEEAPQLMTPTSLDPEEEFVPVRMDVFDFEKL